MDEKEMATYDSVARSRNCSEEFRTRGMSSLLPHHEGFITIDRYRHLLLLSWKIRDSINARERTATSGRKKKTEDETL